MKGFNFIDNAKFLNSIRVSLLINKVKDFSLSNRLSLSTFTFTYRYLLRCNAFVFYGQSYVSISSLHFRGFASSSDDTIRGTDGSKLSLKHDRSDRFIGSIPGVYLDNYIGDGKHLPQKIIRHVYGLKSYFFSQELHFSLTGDDFEQRKDMVEGMVKAFLDGLSGETVYKCMLVGITDDGDIKSPAEGGFLVSKMTSVDYVVMKIKNTVKHSSFKYLNLEFVNWVLAYKVWLRTDVIDKRIREALAMVEEMHKREMLKRDRLLGVVDRVNRTPDLEFYNRWIVLVGIIGSYHNAVMHDIVVREIAVDGGFKVEVENKANGETAS